jgi:Integrase core domain
VRRKTKGRPVSVRRAPPLEPAAATQGTALLANAHPEQDELFFLGIESSPAFIRAPEGIGCAERLIRTLKEQLLWLRPFKNVEELRIALLEWAARYNSSWLIERHGFLTPEQARKNFEEASQAA